MKSFTITWSNEIFKEKKVPSTIRDFTILISALKGGLDTIRDFTCFFVRGNVAALTRTVRRMIAKPYE
jgi:hypothetical protein